MLCRLSILINHGGRQLHPYVPTPPRLCFNAGLLSWIWCFLGSIFLIMSFLLHSNFVLIILARIDILPLFLLEILQSNFSSKITSLLITIFIVLRSHNLKPLTPFSYIPKTKLYELCIKFRSLLSNNVCICRVPQILSSSSNWHHCQSISLR